MSEQGTTWSPKGKLVVLVIVALVGSTGWVIAKVALGREGICKGAKCVSQSVELESDQWSLIEQAERSVTIRFEEGGGCHGFKESEVEEHDGEVRVTMVVGYYVPGEGE